MTQWCIGITWTLGCHFMPTCLFFALSARSYRKLMKSKTLYAMFTLTSATHSQVTTSNEKSMYIRLYVCFRLPILKLLCCGYTRVQVHFRAQSTQRMAIERGMKFKPVEP